MCYVLVTSFMTYLMSMFTSDKRHRHTVGCAQSSLRASRVVVESYVCLCLDTRRRDGRDFVGATARKPRYART